MENTNELLDLRNLLSKIGLLNPNLYLNQSLPCQHDNLLSDFICRYLSLTADNKVRIRLLIDKKLNELLDIYALRMSMVAVRKKSKINLFYGLGALLLSRQADIYRENLMTLSLLHHSAKKLGNEKEIFDEAITLFPELNARNYLKDFIQREAQDQAIGVMGFMEVNTKHGLVYRLGESDIPVNW